MLLQGVECDQAQQIAAEDVLQIKVQVQNPDGFLTPELGAKGEFLKAN